MSKDKSSLSKGQSYKKIGEFWDTRDLTDHWDQTQPVDFEVDVQSEVTYYPIETALSVKLCGMAKQRGVSPETLLNLWVQEKVREEMVQK